MKKNLHIYDISCRIHGFTFPRRSIVLAATKAGAMKIFKTARQLEIACDKERGREPYIFFDYKSREAEMKTGIFWEIS